MHQQRNLGFLFLFFLIFYGSTYADNLPTVPPTAPPNPQISKDTQTQNPQNNQIVGEWTTQLLLTTLAIGYNIQEKQGSRYLVKDFSPPWLKSTRQRAKLKGRDRPASGTLP